MFKREFNKIKGGKVKLYKQFDKYYKKGYGSPAVKKLTDDEIKIQNLSISDKMEGSGIIRKKSIRPLQFKL